MNMRDPIRDIGIKDELVLNFLGKVPIFNTLPRYILNDVSISSTTRKYNKGNVIYRKGDPANWLYLVYSGHVAEFVGFGSSVEIIVKTRKKYDYIGEMGILADRSYPNTAIALERIILIVLSKEMFKELMVISPCILEHITRELIQRLVNSSRNIINAMYLDAPGRLAFTLVNLVNDKGGNSDKHTTVRVTHNELGSTAGMARQTASILLGEWRQRGIVETFRGGIKVKNIDALMDIIIESELS